MPVNSKESSEDYYSAYASMKEGGGEEDSTCSSPQAAEKTSFDDQIINLHTIPRPLSTISQLSNSLKDEMNLPRHLSLETISGILRHPLLEKPTLPAKHRPRRCLTDHDIRLLADRGTPSSFKDDFGHAAAETYLITKLSFKLLKYLGIGYRWMTKLGALGLYALFLMPGFLQVGYSYFYDKRIHRSIVYGQKPRNRLDLYLPENLASPKPVVAFVTGGAWIIGYKAWGSLLGLQLVEKDVIVACIDYRNFPQGTISDMVEDVSQGISYICNNISNYGGDPDRLYLAGQSAGAHLAACALVEQAIKAVRLGKGKQPSDEYQTDEAGITWKPSQFKAYFGVSGGYNLSKLIEHFHQRGLYRTLFLSIMEGELSLLRYSPELRVQSLSPENASTLLPPFFLLHGSADYSIPCDASTTFASTLKSVGVPVETKIYEGKTHTDLFLQDPMRGGRDELFEDILEVVHAGDKEARALDALSEFRRRLVPEFLLQLAHDVSPF